VIKSSKVSIKYANTGRLQAVAEVIDEYGRVLQYFVDYLWELEKIQLLLPKAVTKSADTWLSARLLQCCAKQASGVVRGTRSRIKKQEAYIKKLNKEGKYKKARKATRYYRELKARKPEIKKVQMELDSRFVRIDESGSTCFEYWVTINNLGNKLNIKIPFKGTKHLNKMKALGTLKKGIRLSKKYITLMVEYELPATKPEGEVIGIDIGQTSMLNVSNGVQSTACVHGHTLETISDKLSRKKKGSRAFAKAQAHRSNYINWSVNQLDVKDLKQVNIEDIKDLRRNKRVGRRLTHWTYTAILDKLEEHCLSQGVLVNRVNPAYTSRRCTECGWTCKSNRKRKRFKCVKCGHTADADLNASVNISLQLEPLSKGGKQHRKDGFYWHPEGVEPIVLPVQKVNCNVC